MKINKQLNKKIFLKLSLVCFTLILSSQSINAKSYNKNLKDEFNHIFNQMMNDPSDIDITLAYANKAIEIKDYEAAIPAFERILLFNPELTRIKNDLGILYYNLNSYNASRAYFEEVLRDGNVSQEVETIAKDYLKKLSQK